MASLEITGIEVAYGAVEAVRGVDLSIRTGECVTVLGSNGAGKSSLLRAIGGLQKPRSGSIRIDDTDVTGKSATRMCRLGVALVPEGRRIIGSLTVVENLLLAGRGSKRTSRKECAANLQRMYEHFPRLAERRTQLGGSLSGGEQQMLAIARALMTRPDFLLLDEPSMGLAPVMVDRVYEMFDSAQGVFDGIGVLLVEQSATHALKFADTAHVMAQGSFAYSGTCHALKASPDTLTRAYLGDHDITTNRSVSAAVGRTEGE
ncbi:MULTISPECIES: ABC transporter ATP-binding protein [Streptomyces]|uniref:ABC transporter ATP-binding protein n=1 Tax=Streptomyces TaxID=1883 RepID=UPI0006B04EC3|nr:ABC transporter ATP-binding protein [Streptomyces sp. AS58]KOV53288.1 hypothetical protein ADL00_34735 [Streptomyces sp. AS58]